MTGKRLRLSRIFRADGKAVVIALDHGQFAGLTQGLVNMRRVLDAAALGGADAVILNPGLAYQYADVYAGRLALIVRLTGAMTNFAPRFDYHRQVATVEDALVLGADAVIVMGLVGGEGEAPSLELVGRLAGECRLVGMPLVAEMLPSESSLERDPKWVGFAARLGAELGADVIKVYFTGASSFGEVVQGCPVPILVAGGPKSETSLDVARQAMAHGAAGVAFGRNVFDHDDPRGQVESLVRIVHNLGGEKR